MKAKPSLSQMVTRQKETFLLGAMLLALALAFPAQATAEVNVGISISLPPPIFFPAPPEMVVIPETYVYAVPDVEGEIFFYDGWWWRPWEGRWYRSPYYNSGWAYYQWVPSFYADIPSGWRDDYRDHRWRGQPWNYQRIPHQQVQRNWKGWEKDNHWEKQQTWGVKGLKPRARAQQRSDVVRPGLPASAKPQSRDAVKPVKSRQMHVRPESGTIKAQPSQPQQRKTTKQPSKLRQEKPERGAEEK